MMVSILLWAFAPVLLSPLPQDSADRPVDLFHVPEQRLEQMRLQQVFAYSYSIKDLKLAKNAAEQLLRVAPDDSTAWYNLACVEALTGESQQALQTLQKAVQKGFRDVKRLETDNDLNALQSTLGFAEILKAARVPFQDTMPVPVFEPTNIKDGVALVTASNTHWVEERFSLITSFQPSAITTKKQIVGTSPAERAVDGWIQEGSAAGHAGLLYDNRDRDHSNLDRKKFPQLTFVEYSAEATKAGADWGMRVFQAFDLPTFGNASTAEVGSPFWRSNPRMVMHENLMMNVAYFHFVNNQLYCYPEHNDYDPKEGDVFTANVPYWVISQGSSGSDLPFLEAIALTLAAFRPEVQKLLIEKRLLMPAVQWLLRRSLKPVQTDEDYLSYKAHPVVFQGTELDPLRMVQLAHELTADSLPAFVRLKVLKEDLGVPGVDYFHPRPGEVQFDTPAAISRIYRSHSYQRRMVVDATDSVDVNGLPLRFQWVVLQGDPDHVQIRPLNAAGSQAELMIGWHARASVPGRPGMESNRVDVGVFALNGRSVSLPAFVSSYTLPNEKRVYNEQLQIQSIDYGDAEARGRYVDPLIEGTKSWKDEYHYAGDTLTGWTRLRKGKPSEEFAADGRLIVKKDTQGNPVEWQTLSYEFDPAGQGVPSIEQVVRDPPAATP